MIRALIAGLAVLLAADGAWLIAIQTSNVSEFLILLWWLSPPFAAFVSAYLAPHRKILLGTSLAIPAAILVGLLNTAYQMFGHAVDFPGPRGALILVTTSLVFNVMLCAVGGVVGYVVSTRQQKRAQPE
jgi:hypothetical protein